MNLTSNRAADLHRLGDHSADRRMLVLAAMAPVAGTGGALGAWCLLKLIAVATNKQHPETLTRFERRAFKEFADRPTTPFYSRSYDNKDGSEGYRYARPLYADHSCTTCHAAHQDARRNDPAFYNTRCLACHTQPHQSGNCISCHMPRVQLHPALAFTDHFIR